MILAITLASGKFVVLVVVGFILFGLLMLNIFDKRRLILEILTEENRWMRDYDLVRASGGRVGHKSLGPLLSWLNRKGLVATQFADDRNPEYSATSAGIKKIQR